MKGLIIIREWRIRVSLQTSGCRFSKIRDTTHHFFLYQIKHSSIFTFFLTLFLNFWFFFTKARDWCWLSFHDGVKISYMICLCHSIFTEHAFPRHVAKNSVKFVRTGRQSLQNRTKCQLINAREGIRAHERMRMHEPSIHFCIWARIFSIQWYDQHDWTPCHSQWNSKIHT